MRGGGELGGRGRGCLVGGSGAVRHGGSGGASSALGWRLRVGGCEELVRAECVPGVDGEGVMDVAGG